MTSVQKAVFPGTLMGILFLILFTQAVAGARSVIVAGSMKEVKLPVPVLQSSLGSGQPTTEENPPPEPVEEAAIEPSECNISPTFPQAIQQWCDIISRYASEYHLEPNLVASVMLQESAGNPNAYSHSGAVGLMQVMPKDGLAAKFQCINGPCFASRPSMAELYDPDFNVSYGTRMLSGLIQRHGNVRDALKAYGPMDMGYRYADIILNILQKHQQ